MCWRGEILGVVGGSGTGKSVLLRSVWSAAEAAFGRGPYRGARPTASPMACARAYGAKVRHSVPEGRVVFIADRRTALPLIEHVGLARPLAERLARSKLGLVGLPAGAGESIRPRCPEAW